MVDLLIGFVTGVVCAIGVVVLMAHVMEEREPEDKRIRDVPGIAQKAVCDGCNREFSDEACEPSGCLILEALVHVLPVDAAPVRRGEWIDESEDPVLYPGDTLRCAACGKLANDYIGGTEDAYFVEDPNFCPNCGADMRTARDSVNGEWNTAEGTDR